MRVRSVLEACLYNCLHVSCSMYPSPVSAWQEMVVGARLPCVEMTETRLQAMAAAQTLLDSLPYKIEGGLEALKGSPFDHKNSVGGDSKESVVSRLSLPPTSTSHLQPFTAPWLAEVARISPARAEHLPFVHPNVQTSCHSTPSLTDYYPHFSNLPPRSSYYNHPMFSAPHPYLRDYQPRPSMRPYPLLDPRHTSDVQTVRAQANPSQILPHVRPLGPLPPPPPVSDLPRESRESRLNISPSFSTSSENSHRSIHGEPSPKRRNTHNSPQFSSQQRTGRAVRKPSPPVVSSPESRPLLFSDNKPSTSSSTNSVPPVRSPKKSEPPHALPSGSYYPHFQKGAMVSFGAKMRRVEDMKTDDFIEAADAAEDLTLDPPSVSSMVIASSRGTATISFNFVSRNTEVSSRSWIS